jgi:hypothetical protein
MSRAQVQPVFVDRKTAAEMLMISVDTFDTWLRAGFIPGPQIERGQIMRWHWPTLEEHLAADAYTKQHDPFLEGLKNVQKGRRHAAA